MPTLRKLHVRKGDTVVVLAGKDKGKRGKILVASPSTGRVTVSGINLVTKHQKPKGAQNPGGKTTMEAAISASNVLLLCPKCDAARRHGYKVLETTSKNGRPEKVRYCKKCGATLE